MPKNSITYLTEYTNWEKKLGPEYAALVDGLQDIDPESEVGQEISSTLDALDHLCGG